jgi:endonuclease V-like protein UPF0215 family
MTVKFRKIKPELRILGIDDAPFEKKGGGRTLLVGAVYRGGDFCDGVVSRVIDVDGTDATDKIVDTLKKTRHREQLRVVMLDGITFGGMNVVDIHRIYRETNFPVIVVNRKKPNFENIKKALENFKDGDARWKIIERTGKIKTASVKNHKLYIQTSGIELSDAIEILEKSCSHGHVPEPLRVAHLIAAGVTTGESKGGA